MGLTNPQSANHIAAEAGSLEPQRQNNFSVEIPLDGNDGDLVVMALHGFTLPQQVNEVIEIEYQNEKRKVAGRASAEEGSLTLKDFVDTDVRGAILRWRKQVYDPQTGNIGLAADYKKSLDVVMHGPNGENTRVCKLIGCWPSADPSVELTMDGSDKIMMEVPIQIDKIDWSGSIQGA